MKLAVKRIKCFYEILFLFIFIGRLRDVVVSVVGCGIMVSKFEFQSHHYVYFCINALMKCLNTLMTDKD